MPALVPRPTEVALRTGHFTPDHPTTIRLGTGTEPTADLLRAAHPTGLLRCPDDPSTPAPAGPVREPAARACVGAAVRRCRRPSARPRRHAPAGSPPTPSSPRSAATIHVGGEECPTAEWTHSASARRRVAAEGLPHAQALHGWFLGQIGDFLVRNGRQPVAWAETGAQLPLDSTVMTWHDAAHTSAAARRGHPVINAYRRATYLDHARPDEPHEPPAQPRGRRRPARHPWASASRDTPDVRPVPFRESPPPFWREQR